MRQRLDAYERELRALGDQIQDESKYRQSFDSSHALELLLIESDRIKSEVANAHQHFKKTHEALDSLERSALRSYGDNRSFVSLFSYYLPFDIPNADTWVKIVFWCILPIYTCVIIVLNFSVLFINACLLLDARCLIGKVRLFVRQEELIELMGKTEDIFRQVSMDISSWYESGCFYPYGCKFH